MFKTLKKDLALTSDFLAQYKDSWKKYGCRLMTNAWTNTN